MFLLLTLLLGIVCGLRTFTAPAVLWIMRHGGPWAYVLAGAALFEYFFDLHPKAPPRTDMPGLAGRILSGVFVGWWSGVAVGSVPAWGAAAGAIGAVVGAYGSLAVRRRAILAIGNIGAGVLEDIVAIVAAAAIVVRL